MARDSEARAALRRLAGALERCPDVESVHGEPCEGDWRAWVVVRTRSWDAELPIFQAHVEVDPDFLLTIHVTDSVDQVPDGAELFTGRVAAS
jgi:hypothetical protein